jgi:hypothetical protein
MARKVSDMADSRGTLFLLLLAVGLVCCLPGVFEQRVVLAEEQDGDWQNVSLIYTSDIRGKIDPCG